MAGLFDSEGPLITALTKAGQLIVLGVIWIVCCIPLVTFGTATSSLYYSVMKTVRRDTGYPVREFFAAFRRNLLKGTIVTISIMILIFLVWLNREYIIGNLAGGADSDTGMILHGMKGGISLVIVYDVLAGLAAGWILYFCAVLSRFQMSLGRLCRLAFVMEIRFFYITLLLVGGTALMGYLQYRWLPIPCLAAWPGVWMYLVSFPMEKALKRYMPKPEEGQEQWFDR